MNCKKVLEQLHQNVIAPLCFSHYFSGSIFSLTFATHFDSGVRNRVLEYHVKNKNLCKKPFLLPTWCVGCCSQPA